jgi:metallophosphoesterase superfamily enzyme
VTARAQSLNEELPSARIAGIDVAGVTLIADLSGALFWEQQRLLVVSDLHLEKGSSFAARGVLLPPYDTVATLGRLASVIARHDPSEVAIGAIAFRHEPTGAAGEIAGHLHPKACVPTRARWIERRCFVSDGERAVMPAFGAYTGGLSIRDKAFAKIFQTPGFVAHVLGDNRLHVIAASRCY